jgi:hypothetical protein
MGAPARTSLENPLGGPFSLAPIHRSEWKGSSTKSVSRVWDTRHPKGQGRRRSGFVAFRVDRHMLWRCIEMRLAAWRGRRVGPRGYPAPSRYRYLPGPSCASCAHAPVGPGLPVPSGPFAAFCGVSGALSIRRPSAAKTGCALRVYDARVGEGGYSRTRESTNGPEVGFRAKARDGTLELWIT